MAISAEEQERLWEEAERAEERNILAQSVAQQEAREMIVAQAQEEAQARKLYSMSSNNFDDFISPGKLIDSYEFEVKPISTGETPEPSEQSTLLYSDDRNNAVVLGEGAYGRVLRGRQKDTHEIVAIKEIRKAMLMESDHKILKKEVLMLKECTGHRHVLEFKAVHECDDYFDIVTEEAEGGELHDRLTELTDHLEEDVVKNIAFNLLDAIAFLQERNIAHRDIKPENILLRKPKGVHGDILLCDFGFATKCNGKSLKKNCGSTSYMAPEVIRGDYYDYRCDVWSVGVVIHRLITADKLYKGSTDKSTEKLVKKSPLFVADISEPGVPISDTHPLLLDASLHARQVICACLDPVQERRPLAKQLLEHAWFEGMVPKSNSPSLQPASTTMQSIRESSTSTRASDSIRDSKVVSNDGTSPPTTTKNMNPLLDLFSKQSSNEARLATPISETPVPAIDPVRMNSSVNEIAPYIRDMDTTFVERQMVADELAEYCDNETPSPPLKAQPSSSKPLSPRETSQAHLHEESSQAIVPRRRRFSWMPSLFRFNSCLDE